MLDGTNAWSFAPCRWLRQARCGLLVPAGMHSHAVLSLFVLFLLLLLLLLLTVLECRTPVCVAVPVAHKVRRCRCCCCCCNWAPCLRTPSPFQHVLLCFAVLFAVHAAAAAVGPHA
jgi:hypothetical protein